MNILFIHSNYPAQFHWLAADLGAQGKHDVRFLTARQDASEHPLPGVKVELFVEPDPNLPSASPLHTTTDNAISRAAVIETRLLQLAQEGFVPRLVVVHGGNGLGLLIKQLIPNCALIGYFEWYFSAESAELLLGTSTLLTRNQAELRNLVISQELLVCDSAVIPTAWQANQFPEPLRQKLQVVFDGVDPLLSHPPEDSKRNWPLTLDGENGAVVIDADQPLLTYATRGMEPLRGFPEFMRALPIVVQRIPTLRIVIAGRDRSAYGAPCPTHQGSWKLRLLDELGHFPGVENLDFCGLLTRADFTRMLQRSNLHCYFSRPYVTSWSLFEAVACGSPVLTNPGPTTTGTIQSALTSTISLDCAPREMAEAIVKGLSADSSCISSSPPAWLWRENSRKHWEQLINTSLRPKSQALVPVC